MKGFWIWGCGVRSENLKQFLDNLEAEDPLGVGLYGEHYVGVPRRNYNKPTFTHQDTKHLPMGPRYTFHGNPTTFEERNLI